MKNKKLLSKILGMTMLLVMMLVPALNVEASYTPHLLYITKEEGEFKRAYYDVFEIVGEHKSDATLNAIDSEAKTATMTFDKDAKIIHLATDPWYSSDKSVSLTINLDGDNEIRTVDSTMVYNIQGKGTLTLSSIGIWDNMPETDSEGNFLCSRLYFRAEPDQLQSVRIEMPTVSFSRKQIPEVYEDIKAANPSVIFPEEYVEGSIFCETPDYYYSDENYVAKEITKEWADEHIVAEGKKVEYVDGKIIITDEESEEPTNPEDPIESEEYVLTTEGIEFISDKPFDENLTLVKTDYLEMMELIENEEDKEFLEIRMAEIEELLDKKIVGFYDIEVQNENHEVIPMKDGNFKIRIKLTDEMKKYDYLIVAYIDDENDDIEYFGTTIYDDYLTFNTSHLSTYVVLGGNIETTENIDNPNTVDHIGLYLIIALAGLAGLTITTIYLKKSM